MRRALAPTPRTLLLAAAVAAPLLGGCSREQPPAPPVSYETLPDTAGLSRGTPLLERFEPYRMANGAVRVTGRVRLPDSTRVQIAIRKPGARSSVAMAQVFVLGQQFDTPPLLGDGGPLPAGDYRFELLAHFNSDWQSPRVLRAIANGKELRGPGVTRARNGDAALLVDRTGHL